MCFYKAAVDMYFRLVLFFFYAVESVLVSCAKIINELLDDVWAKAPRSSV